MSLYDRDSGYEPERTKRRLVPACSDGYCGASDCPRCGHETEMEDLPVRRTTKQAPYGPRMLRALVEMKRVTGGFYA